MRRSGSRKHNKYHNRKVHYDGFTFDSLLEAEDYILLKRREAKGEILNLKRQVPYQFIHEGRLICTYKADFVYDELTALNETLKKQGFTSESVWISVTEDAKGIRTDVYKLKRRMMQVFHGIEIREWPHAKSERIPEEELEQILGIEIKRRRKTKAVADVQ